MPHRLVGNWNLESYDAIAPDGTRSLPFGHAVGRLSYDEHGHMSGQVMRPDRAAVNVGREGEAQTVRAAYIGYIAYFGKYAVDDEAGVVTHHVRGALNPSWVGGHQVRKMRFDGDRLVLQADVKKGNQVIVHVLTWRRLP